MTDEVFYAVRLYRYKQTLLGGSNWKETWLQLKSDGSLIWYNDKQCSRACPVLNINNVAAYIKIGEIAKRRLSKLSPKLPYDFCNSSCLMAVPDRNSERVQDNVRWFWFCFKNEKDLLLTLEHFATFFDYKKEFEQFFNFDSFDDGTGRRYRRYGTPLSGDTDTPKGETDWGTLWEKFMIEIAPYRFLRRRPKGKKYTQIEVISDSNTTMYDVKTEKERKDSCIDTESGDSFIASEPSSHFESEDIEINSSDNESVSRKSEVTVEIHSTVT